MQVVVLRSFNRIWLLILCVISARSLAAEPRKWEMELRAGRFRIHSDFELTASDELIRELNRLTADVEQLLRLEESSNPIHIVLFETVGEYDRYMQNYFPDLPRRRAMYIQHRGPGMLFTHWHNEVETDLRHEVVHALLNDGQSLPLWLDEGLAEYFEIATSQRLDSNPYHAAVTQQSAEGGIQSISELESAHSIGEFGDQQYRDSWAWVHYMLHRKQETRDLLVRYLHERASGVEPFDLGRALHHLSPELSSDFAAHFRSLLAKRMAKQDGTGAVSR